MDITTLSGYQLQELFNYIDEILTLGSLKGSLNNDLDDIIIYNKNMIKIKGVRVEI